MSEDENIRANRMAVMAQLSALPGGILDFSQLPGF